MKNNALYFVGYKMLFKKLLLDVEIKKLILEIRDKTYSVRIILMSLLLGHGLSGCYPIYKTQKPELEVTVVDEQNQPVEKAKVVLITEVHPAKIDAQFDQKTTNSFGKANFAKQSKWQVEFLMIHGVQHYNWNICVVKSGYVTQGMIDVNQDKIKVILVPKKAIKALDETEKVLQKTIEMMCSGK